LSEEDRRNVFTKSIKTGVGHNDPNR
jgi:hypothetical protein